MPTPVSSARQCLADEAAHALDDAVAAARRRGHAQTTSLHAVSALLALPSSLIRDACSRGRSTAYSPRLQFRALELSLGVSLDRLPSSKSADDPPVSNSLMAAIRRSQADQRRHPYHLQIQQQQSTASLSIIKVELKHFVLSILDDPIVSKVFLEAGFRSYDIKLGILNPPAPPLARFSSSRFPSPSLGSRFWGDSCSGTRGFTFPFSASPSVDGAGNCRRIGEVLGKKSGKNPLLIGAYVSAALSSFVDSVHKGGDGVLPAQISGLKLICITKEVSEFVAGPGNEEQLDLKVRQLDTVTAEHRSGPGIVVNFGELGVLIGDGSSCDALSRVVTKLTDLLKLHGDKLWLIGAAESYEIYSKFLSRFPSIDKQWDLHLLPITSAFEELYPKSSLMGSFVPLGGFFSAPSDLQNPPNSVIQSGNHRNEKYDQGVSAILKRGSGSPVSDHHSTAIPSWLQMEKIHLSLLPCHAVSTDLQLGMQQPKSTDSVRELDPGDFKILWKSLSEKVGRQDEAVYSISQAVSLCSTSNGRCRGSMFKRGIWLGLLGPDRLGKKRMALALAETIFGSSRSLISVDLGSRYGFSQPDSVFHHDELNFRGKTVVDYIAGELRENPRSVVFLESIEKADVQVQDSLSRAVSTGKFPDSHGREVGVNGAIFLAASSLSLLPEKKTHEFSEERILGAKNWQLRILLGSVAGDLERRKPKRELSDPSDLQDPKRVDLTAKSFLDLNLPVTETQEGEGVRNSETPDGWVMGFYGKVDRKVVLVPFDFDGLARKVVKEINCRFKKMVGGDAVLEIDPEVTVQIVAAGWAADGKRAVEDWVEQVLGASFVEVGRRYGCSMAPPLLRLVACEGVLVGEEEQSLGIRLPARVGVDGN